jgi:hypothetical protein
MFISRPMWIRCLRIKSMAAAQVDTRPRCLLATGLSGPQLVIRAVWAHQKSLELCTLANVGSGSRPVGR